MTEKSKHILMLWSFNINPRSSSLMMFQELLSEKHLMQVSSGMKNDSEYFFEI